MGHDEFLRNVNRPNVAVLVGNPRPASRTRTVAVQAADRIAQLLGGSVGPVVDLAVHGPEVLSSESVAVDRDVKALANSDILIVASPIYKATYTGLLKAFLDRFGSVDLAGTVAIPVMMGGAPNHAMAVEVHLRPLLVELGCTVPTRGLFVLDADLENLSDTIDSWANSALLYLERAVSDATE